MGRIVGLNPKVLSRINWTRTDPRHRAILPQVGRLGDYFKTDPGMRFPTFFFAGASVTHKIYIIDGLAALLPSTSFIGSDTHLLMI